MEAAYEGKGSAVTTLVEYGASLDLQDTYGQTALYYASAFDHPSIVTFLVGMGADQTIKSSSGKTALDWATQNGNAEVVAVLKNPEKVSASSFQK